MNKTHRELEALVHEAQEAYQHHHIEQDEIERLTHQAKQVEHVFYLESGTLDLVELQIEETHEGAYQDGTHFLIADPEIYEPYTDDPTELYHNFSQEYGLHQDKIYVDTQDNESVPVGYIFTKTEKYTDSEETYEHTVWVTFIKIYNNHKYYINIETHEPIL